MVATPAPLLQQLHNTERLRSSLRQLIAHADSHQQPVNVGLLFISPDSQWRYAAQALQAVGDTAFHIAEWNPEAKRYHLSLDGEDVMVSIYH